MDKLISEQAVIDSIEFFQMNPQHFSFVNLIYDIKEIPSAEPQTGYWEEWKNYLHSGIVYSCSKCGSFVHEKTNFCPDCGVKMKK